MALQEVTEDGVLITPGAYGKVNVITAPGSLGTNGIVAIIGEATAGDAFDEETDLSENFYGPDQIADVQAKYKTGNLVDAFRGVAQASADPNITGSVSRVFVLKTNVSGQATNTLPTIGGGSYADITDKSSGKSGNLISYKVEEATAEVVPTTGSFLWAPPQVTTGIEFRVDGAAAVAPSDFTTGALPSAFVSAVTALTGVLATGGASRSVITSVAGTITPAVVSGRTMTFTISTAWANNPSVGDIMYIPTGSPMATANEGTYVVTAATNTVITAYKLLDAAGSGAAITNPVGESAATIAATTDLQAFSPIVVSQEAGAVKPGHGKTLEIADAASGTLANNIYVFSSASASPPAAAATWVSYTGNPQVIVSGTEYTVTTTISRQSDSVDDAITTGGDVVLTLGYLGTTGSAVIADGVMTVTVAGGSGTSPAAITLADYTTVADLVTYFNSLTGFTAAAGSTLLGQYSPSDLDPGTYGIGSSWGAKTGRIKSDGAEYLADVTAGSVLADITAISPATQLIGLPDVKVLTFLTGGTTGATTNTRILSALSALEGIRLNFVVPLFSRDATADISAGYTDSSSTYTIDAIHSNTRSHVLLMSQYKRQRSRIGLVSYRGTFAAAKAAAANMSNSRVVMTFQDVKGTDASGNTKQFQPWMGAVKAAGMQAGGFYKSIMAKFIDITGAVQAAGDFNDQLITDTDTACLSGLLYITKDENGGYKWGSDQTTYTVDDNFVRNSLQAMYASDLVSSTTSTRMGRAFVGQSVSDVPASLALTVLEGIMQDLKRLKLLAASDDAPKGFKNATIRIVPPAMRVTVEVKLATAIAFIPITFNVTPVQQSAG